MSDPDPDGEFPGVFLGANEGEGEDGSSAAGSGGEADSQAAPPYVGAGEATAEDGAGDTGDGT